MMRAREYRTVPAIVASVLLGAGLSAELQAQCTCLEIQKLQDAGGADLNRFGHMVAVSGDLALVGVPGKGTGVVFAYRWDGTRWVQFQTLVGSDGASFDEFGFSGVIDGTTALVSAPLRDVPGFVNVGAVYAFEFDGTLWQEVDTLVPAAPLGSERFGWSVALRGGVAVVGAPLAGAGQGLSWGTAYAFRHDGTRFVEEQRLDSLEPGVHNRHGHGVATDGKLALVSSLDDVNGTGAGSVIAYEFDGTTWVKVQKFAAATTSPGDSFGWSVAMDTTGRALVGAVLEDDPLPDNGAVYAFAWNGSQWSEQQRIVASDPGSAPALGQSLALCGDRFLAGSSSLSGGGGVNLFQWTGASWVHAHAWLNSDPATVGFSDQLGYSVALDGPRALSGARFADAASMNSGAAYAFDPSDLALDAIPDVVPAGGTLELRTCGGRTGSLLVLAVVSIQGVPGFLKLAVSPFDGQGMHRHVGTVPPGLSGMTLDLVSIGDWQPGVLGVSNTVTLSFP